MIPQILIKLYRASQEWKICLLIRRLVLVTPNISILLLFFFFLTASFERYARRQNQAILEDIGSTNGVKILNLLNDFLQIVLQNKSQRYHISPLVNNQFYLEETLSTSFLLRASNDFLWSVDTSHLHYQRSHKKKRSRSDAAAYFFHFTWEWRSRIQSRVV